MCCVVWKCLTAMRSEGSAAEKCFGGASTGAGLSEAAGFFFCRNHRVDQVLMENSEATAKARKPEDQLLRPGRLEAFESFFFSATRCSHLSHISSKVLSLPFKPLGLPFGLSNWMLCV